MSDSDNDFGSLTEFFNSLIGALENPQDDPELAELIDQALQEDDELNSKSAARSPGRPSEQANAKKPSNLGEHLLAAVGKAEEISSGNADDGGDHGDESRGDETRGDIADSGIAGTSNGGPTCRVRGMPTRNQCGGDDRSTARLAVSRLHTGGVTVDSEGASAASLPTPLALI